MNTLVVVLLILVLALAFGGYGQWGARSFGIYGWSPAVIVLVVLLVLFLTGRL